MVLLSYYKYSAVRIILTSLLGAAFPHIPDKNKAWEDLIRLSHDIDDDMKASTNYSLGMASIFKATEAKNEEAFREELEKAIEFFEKSSKKAVFMNFASFCLPFYRSFYSITFENLKAKEEVQKYLREAKMFVGVSESKEQLLKVVKKLANELSKAQKISEMGFDVMKLDLNAHRLSCEEAANILSITREKAPRATKLIERGLPIIDQRIKDIIIDIQEKASIACQQSKGTKAEEIACAANREVQKWKIGDQEQMTQNVDNLIFVLSLKVPSAPEFKYIHNEIEQIRLELDITKQYQKISYLIALIPSSVHMGDNINQNVSGNNNQVIGKCNGNKDKGEKSSSIISKTNQKKSVIDRINPPATIAAFVGFISVEIGTYYYPISYNHIIGAVIALLVFIIVAIFNKS